MIFAWHHKPRAASVTIAGAAIRYSDLGVRALPLPASHEDISRLVAETLGSRAGKHKGEAGYITNRGRFVGGKEALIIARRAQQLGSARIGSDELSLDYLRAMEPGCRRPDELIGAATLTIGRTGSAPRRYRGYAGGQLVLPQELNRQLLHTSGRAAGSLLLAWALCSALPQLVIDFPDGVPWLTLMGHAALYGIMGLAVAQVIHARGAQNRSAAIYAFVVLLALWQLWPVVALTGSQLGTSALVGATLLVALVTVTLFGRIRTIGALLLLPATVWLAVAAYRAFHPL